MSGKPEDASLKDEIIQKLHNITATLISMYSSEQVVEETNASEKIVEEFTTIIPFDDVSKRHLANQLEQLPATEEKQEFLSRIITDIYQKREEQVGKEIM